MGPEKIHVRRTGRDRGRHCRVQQAMMTAYRTVEDAVAAMKEGVDVRELQNVIERACLLARCEVIQIHDLHLRDDAMGSPAPGESPFNSEFRLGRDSAIPGRPGGSENEPATGDSESSTLQEMERRMILKTLRRTGGNRTRAAQLLGVSVRTIRNKLNQYDLRGKALQAK